MNHLLSAAKMNTLSLLVLLLPSLGISAMYTPEDCIGGFGALQFQILNFDAYNTYFDEESTFLLPQTGIYKGPDAIEEYVRFVDIGTIYWEQKVDNIESLTTFSASRFDPIAGTCVFSVYSSQYLRLNTTLTNGEFANYAAFQNVQYSIPDNKIRAITLYYEPDFLSEFFGLLDTPGVHHYICETLHSDACTAELAGPTTKTAKKTHKGTKKNKTTKKLTKKDERQRTRDIRRCVHDIARLPVAEGALGYADGNTQACRVVHGSFAGTNPFHCAHLALEPTADASGATKCSVSAGVSPDDLFNEEELAGLVDFCKNSAVVDDNCYRITTENSVP